MTGQTEALTKKKNGSKFLVGPDTWAVIVALGLALLVGIGVIKHVPW